MRRALESWTAAWLVAFALLSGCALGPDYARPELDLPERYREETQAGEDFANLPWWELFEDPVLQRLVRVALADNKDLLIAVERVEAARAILGVTRADQFPRIDAAGSARRLDPGDEAFSFSANPQNSFGIFADLSFELDIWGKLRRATEAQRAELLASEYGKRAVTVSLISQVALTYLRILGIDERMGIAGKTTKNRRGATKLVSARFKEGVIPELDVNQAQIEEAESEIATASLERELRAAESSLSVLLGSPPGPIERGLPLREQAFASPIPAGFPAALLERRPDVIAAEERAKAAAARIGVAKAERLPSLDLLGFIGFASRDTNRLLLRSAMTWSVGGDLLAPLLDWGKGASKVDLTEAEARASLRAYENSVLRAVQEVEDSLAEIRTYSREEQQRGFQVKASSNAARLSRARYDDGVTSYLEVLDIERSLFESELGRSEAREGYLASIVRLYKALGGGWDKCPVKASS